VLRREDYSVFRVFEGPADKVPIIPNVTTDEFDDRFRKQFPKSYGRPLPSDTDLLKGFFWPTQICEAIKDYVRQTGLFGGGLHPIWYDGVYVDFVPAGPGKLWAILLARDPKLSRAGHVRIWELTGEWVAEHQRWRVKSEKDPDYDITTDFCDPFVAFVRGGTFYFVTPVGDLHSASDLKPGGIAKTVRRTLGAGQKVGAIIGDADTGRTFVFGKPALWRDTEQLNFYCELTEKGPLALKWYDQGAVKPVEYPAVPKRLAAVDQLARVLKAEKLLPE
jgi:hypothetical protein